LARLEAIGMPQVISKTAAGKVPHDALLRLHGDWLVALAGQFAIGHLATLTLALGEKRIAAKSACTDPSMRMRPSDVRKF
jgi:hypothetical protein